MKQAEYVGEVLEDGHLSLPEAVREELGLEPDTLVRVRILVQEADRKQVEDVWGLFRAMGRDVLSGQLSNASAEHDRYLYERLEDKKDER